MRRRLTSALKPGACAAARPAVCCTTWSSRRARCRCLAAAWRSWGSPVCTLSSTWAQAHRLSGLHAMPVTRGCRGPETVLDCLCACHQGPAVYGHLGST